MNWRETLNKIPILDAFILSIIALAIFYKWFIIIAAMLIFYFAIKKMQHRGR